MKKSVKALLLAVLVISTVCVLTIFASAAEVVDTGLVMKYSTYVADDSEENILNDGTTNDVTWTLTDDGVLTISSVSSSDAMMNPHAGWRNGVNYKAYIPWYSYLKDVKSVVVEESVTAVTSANFFTSLENCESITFKAASVKLGSVAMIFSNLPKLNSLKFEGNDYSMFEGNVVDLRNFTGTSEQAFEGSCRNMDVSVLMPYTAANPIKELKVFHETTNVTFYVIEGSLAATSAANIKRNADNYDTYTQTSNRTPYVKNVTIKNYDLSSLGTVTGGVEGEYQYTLDIGTGSLIILNKYTGGWQQFDTHGDEWQAFKNAWGIFVKDAVIASFNKISFGGGSGKTPLFAGFTNLETVTFQAGQRMQNGAAASIGWFQGCTALKSITFGGELEDGVFDFSGMTFHGEDSPSVYLDNIFNGCAAVEEVIFPNNEILTAVKATTFKGCTNLKKVTLLENITTIEDGAFADCPDVVLTVVEDSFAHTWADANNVDFELYVEEAPATFYEGKFAEKNELTYYYDVETQVLTIAGEGDVLEMDYALNYEGTHKADTNGDEIEETLATLPWLKLGFAGDVKEVVIEAEISGVGAYMLSRFSNVEKITIPASLTSLGQGALAYNNALKTIAVAGEEAEEGVYDFTNIVNFSAYVFDGALANVTPTVVFGNDLKSFGTSKIAQKCAKLTLKFEGESSVAAAGFIVNYKTGAYAESNDYCKNIVFEYELSNPVVFEGYSVRLTGYNGLRSIYSINMNTAALVALDTGKSIKEYGTIIGTYENMSSGDWELDEEGNVTAEKIIKTVVYSDGEFVGKRLESSTETRTDFAVTLINIAEEHYETPFWSVAYAIYEDEEGNRTVEYCGSEAGDIKTVATNMYEAGLFDEETGPVAMEIVNYGKDAAEVVAYTEKCYL